MNRQKLRIDDLSVESFETIAPEQPRGTVAGHATVPFEPVSCACVTDEFQSCPFTCGLYSCDGGTCAATCQTCGTTNPGPTEVGYGSCFGAGVVRSEGHTP